MAYLRYGDARTPITELPFPVVVTGVDGERHHYDAYYPEHPASEPWTPTTPRTVNGPLTRDIGLQERQVPSNNLFLPRNSPGPPLRQNLHVMTNVPSNNGVGMWAQNDSGAPFVQSPSSYSLPSPTLPGVPSAPRHKISDITFDGVSYIRVGFDFTRHLDGEAIRGEIISRLPQASSSSSGLDIFRIHPAGSDEALSDADLVADVQQFGDHKGWLKFSVRAAADRYTDPYFPSYTRAPTMPVSPNHSGPIHFPSVGLPIPPPHSSVADWGERYRVPTPNARAYTHSVSRSWDGRPSGPITMSMPVPVPMTMPTPAPMGQSTGQGAPGFPTPDYSGNHVSTPTFSKPTPAISAQPIVGQSFIPAPAEFPPPFNSVAETKRSRHISDYYGRETLGGSIVDSHDVEYRCRTSTAGARPHSVVIGGAMTTHEVLSHLYERGCRDVVNELNSSRISKDPVARGGGGDVYSGELHTGERVALKCVRLAIGNDDHNKLKASLTATTLHNQQLPNKIWPQKTAHELYVWSKCNHLNVMKLIGVTRHRDQVAMVSPWMDHGDLPTFLRENPGADRHNLCMQIADGVAYLHEQDIVHGDIKGANVLVSQDHVAKITDFGTSVLKCYTLEFATTKSKPGLSLRWAAPEILEEKSDNSSEADVYSLAMTILEAVTGSIPYVNIAKDCVVMRNIIQGTPPARPEAHIPSNDYYGDLLWSLLSRCWAYEYQSRPSAVEVKHQMRSLVF